MWSGSDDGNEYGPLAGAGAGAGAALTVCENGMVSQVLDHLDAGREAVAQRRWADAYELLRGADEEAPLAPEDLELLGEATQWTADPEAAMPYYERAYASYLEAENPRRA